MLKVNSMKFMIDSMKLRNGHHEVKGSSVKLMKDSMKLRGNS